MPRGPRTIRTDASGRRLALREIEWTALFDPKTVAVVGASDSEGSQQRGQWVQVRDRLGARGATVIPVHPTKAEILGTPAYRSLLDVPLEIELAIVLVRDPIPVIEECIAKGVKVAVVFAAGFSEVGTAEGRAKEARLRELARGPVRVMGPNTNLNIFEPWAEIPARKMAIVTQSGHQGRPISQGQELGIAVQSWATIGNECDLEFADFVAYYAGLPDTGVIAAYVEGFRDGRTLMLAADRAALARVPIVVIKVGRSEEGRKMAQAHTGHLTGADAVHDAVFAQTGIVRVDDLDEVIEISGMFCHTALLRGEPGGGGVAIYALSGGTASHMVDLCSAAGLPVPRLEAKTIEGLRAHIPWFLRCDNPVDSGGTITATPAGRAVLELLVDDANTEVLIVPITGVFAGMSDALARDLVELHVTGRKTIIAIWSSPKRDDPAYHALIAAGVPLFHSFGAAVRGTKALVDYSAYVRRYRSPFRGLATRPEPHAAAWRADLKPGRALNEVEGKRLLAAYGIATVAELVATNAKEAVAAAESIGFPVVMKILSAAIGHKSDLGLVEIGIGSSTEARSAYRRLVRQAAAQAPGVAVDGVVVQRHVTGAVAEAILGLSQQAPFGPTVLYGLGGVFTEVFEDVSFGVPPFSKAYARSMVERTRSHRLLTGVRGRPKADIAALVQAIMSMQRIALDLGHAIAELDVNPLLVLPAGQGVVAVDALVVAAADGAAVTPAPPR